MHRSLFFAIVLLTACSSSSSTPAPSAGTDAGGPAGTAVPGATLTFTVNGLAIVADQNLHGKSNDGTTISIGGDHAETTSTKYWTVNIDLGNVSAAGTYKCTDNNQLITTKPRTTFTYSSADGSIILNQPANPMSAPFTGDCTINLTTWAAKAGDHYVGTFTATGLKNAAGNVDITDGVFDVTRTAK